MKPSSKMRQCWCQFKINPFVSPLLAGWAVFSLVVPQLGAGWFSILLLWGALWAVLEHVAPKGHPKHRVHLLTPNFYAVQDFSGCWRIFQRRPEHTGDCQDLLKELLEDQRRLPAALKPGLYRTLTHDTILTRLKRMDNVAIRSSSPAYVTTLEETITRAVGHHCRLCTEHCPFYGRQKPRQFYDVRFLIKEEADNGIRKTDTCR